LTFIYGARKSASKTLSSILFFNRLRGIFAQEKYLSERVLELFLTTPTDLDSQPENDPEKIAVLQKLDKTYIYPQRLYFRRFEKEDLLRAIGPVAKRSRTLAYVCGPPAMTDWAVAKLKEIEGMDEKRVLCEKWW